MIASSLRRVLVVAVCAFALLGPAVLEAASGSGGSCSPPAFTGSVRAHASACGTKTPPSPEPEGQRGPRGPRGFSGLRGVTGRSGPVGLAGPTGHIGLQGLQGVQGSLGATGATGSGSQGLQGVQGNIGAAGLTGSTGLTGAIGAAGSIGASGASGQTGPQGTPGATGSTGTTGAIGATGVQGSTGVTGSTGPTGLQGVPGITGSTGASGSTGPSGSTGATGAPSIVNFADFYALMPPDNGATVALGAAVEFPDNGPSTGTIAATSPTTFALPDIGVYSVTFSVPVDEAGQLALFLNGAPLLNTVIGRATGTSPIAETTLIQTVTPNSLLSVNNESAAALTITPNAGGPHPDTATLVIEELN